MSSVKGATLRSFFEEMGEWEEVQALAHKKAIAEALRRQMEKTRTTKAALARRMKTSRSQIEVLLDPTESGLTLLSLGKATHALGLRFEITFQQANAKRRTG
jgi:antitoxin HicB